MDQHSRDMFNQLSTRLFRVAAYYVANEVAADLAQDTLLAAMECPEYTKAASKEEKECFLIRKITENAALLAQGVQYNAIDFLRRPANNPQRNQPIESLVEVGREPPSKEDSESLYAQKQALSAVERILQKPPHKNRAKALRDHLFDNRPAEEVAEQAGCSVRQFYNWLAEFRASCKKAAPIDSWAT